MLVTLHRSARVSANFGFTTVLAIVFIFSGAVI